MQLLDSLMAAVIWLGLTLISRAIGKKFIPETAPVRDTLIDVLTLTMAAQFALAMGDTPLVSSIVDFILAQLRDVQGGETIPSVLVGILIAGVFGFFGFKKAKTFMKFDEQAFAWKELALFTVCFLVIVKLVPWVNDAMNKVTEYFSTPVGSFVLKFVNNLVSIDF